jgi:hypothetical protein
MGEHLERVVITSSDPPPPITANDFVPEDRDLSECITAVPRPGCGSEARSDWHQGLVLALMVAGLVLVGWRIAKSVRKRETDHREAAKDTADPRA